MCVCVRDIPYKTKHILNIPIKLIVIVVVVDDDDELFI